MQFTSDEMVLSVVESEKSILDMLLQINQDNHFFSVSTNKIGAKMAGNILKSEDSNVCDNGVSL